MHIGHGPVIPQNLWKGVRQDIKLVQGLDREGLMGDGHVVLVALTWQLGIKTTLETKYNHFEKCKI